MTATKTINVSNKKSNKLTSIKQLSKSKTNRYGTKKMIGGGWFGGKKKSEQQPLIVKPKKASANAPKKTFVQRFSNLFSTKKVHTAAQTSALPIPIPVKITPTPVKTSEDLQKDIKTAEYVKFLLGTNKNKSNNRLSIGNIPKTRTFMQKYVTRKKPNLTQNQDKIQKLITNQFGTSINKSIINDAITQATKHKEYLKTLGLKPTDISSTRQFTFTNEINKKAGRNRTKGNNNSEKTYQATKNYLKYITAIKAIKAKNQNNLTSKMISDLEGYKTMIKSSNIQAKARSEETRYFGEKHAQEAIQEKANANNAKLAQSTELATNAIRNILSTKTTHSSGTPKMDRMTNSLIAGYLTAEKGTHPSDKFGTIFKSEDATALDEQFQNIIKSLPANVSNDDKYEALTKLVKKLQNEKQSNKHTIPTTVNNESILTLHHQIVPQQPQTFVKPVNSVLTTLNNKIKKKREYNGTKSLLLQLIKRQQKNLKNQNLFEDIKNLQKQITKYENENPHMTQVIQNTVQTIPVQANLVQTTPVKELSPEPVKEQKLSPEERSNIRAAAIVEAKATIAKEMESKFKLLNDLTTKVKNYTKTKKPNGTLPSKTDIDIYTNTLLNLKEYEGLKTDKKNTITSEELQTLNMNKTTSNEFNNKLVAIETALQKIKNNTKQRALNYNTKALEKKTKLKALLFRDAAAAPAAPAAPATLIKTKPNFNTTNNDIVINKFIENKNTKNNSKKILESIKKIKTNFPFMEYPNIIDIFINIKKYKDSRQLLDTLKLKLPPKTAIITTSNT